MEHYQCVVHTPIHHRVAFISTLQSLSRVTLHSKLVHMTHKHRGLNVGPMHNPSGPQSSVSPSSNGD